MEEVYYLSDQFDRILVTVVDNTVTKINVLHLVSEPQSTKMRPMINALRGLSFESFKFALQPLYKAWHKL